MASVHDVASYILHKTGSISTWKLQKLAYYSQAWNLVWEEKPLFDAQIQAWSNGPVVPELYKVHRGKYSIGRWPKGSGARLTDSEKEVVDAVLSGYGQLTGHQLSVLTHSEDPWKEARAGLRPTQRSVKQIKPEAMRAYYTWLDANVEARPVDEIDWDALADS
ncbi:MAG: Panacea domain-containing protein [Solirubrobacterales bacterium]